MLIVRELTVRFDGTAALEHVSLEVARGEVVCLLGPSGSGKSTLLRVVAGIEHPTEGRVVIDDAEVAGPSAFVEPERRRVGMVFQDFALFPHLTVAENVAFGLARRERDRVTGLLERLGLARLARSYPHTLSGGERQRVALARAMAPKPRLLLMDEPFSSLDSRLRDDVRRHTLRFVRDSGTTTVIVTHDPDEALRIADRIALLEGGRLVQLGTPQELYSRPSTLFAARFFSDVAAVAGTCRGGQLATPLGSFNSVDCADGAAAVACIRPEHLKVATGRAGISARVVSAEYRGDSRYLLVAVEGLEEPLALNAPEGATASGDEIRPGVEIRLEIDADDVPIVAPSQNWKESLDAQQTFA